MYGIHSLLKFTAIFTLNVLNYGVADSLTSCTGYGIIGRSCSRGHPVNDFGDVPALFLFRFLAGKTNRYHRGNIPSGW